LKYSWKFDDFVNYRFLGLINFALRPVTGFGEDLTAEWRFAEVEGCQNFAVKRNEERSVRFDQNLSEKVQCLLLAVRYGHVAE